MWKWYAASNAANMATRLRYTRVRRRVLAARGNKNYRSAPHLRASLNVSTVWHISTTLTIELMKTTHQWTKIATAYTISSEGTDKILNTNMAYFTNTSISNGTKIWCLQINLQHSRAATGNLQNFVHQCDVDIIFAQEPYVINNKVAGMSHHYKIITQGNGKIRAAIK